MVERVKRDLVFILPTGVPALSRTPYLHIKISLQGAHRKRCVPTGARLSVLDSFGFTGRLSGRGSFWFSLSSLIGWPWPVSPVAMGHAGHGFLFIARFSMYELVGWSLLVDKMKTYYDALQCNDCDKRQIAECIKHAIDWRT